MAGSVSQGTDIAAWRISSWGTTQRCSSTEAPGEPSAGLSYREPSILTLNGHTSAEYSFGAQTCQATREGYLIFFGLQSFPLLV